MVRKSLLIAGLLFLFFCPSAWSGDLAAWTKKYGENLDNVPLFVIQQYQLTTGQSWFDISLQERFDHLNALEAKQKQDAQAKENALKIVKQNKERENQRIQARKEALRRVSDLKRTKAEQKKADHQRRMEKLKRIAEVRKQKMKAFRDKNKR